LEKARLIGSVDTPYCSLFAYVAVIMVPGITMDEAAAFKKLRLDSICSP
jgi:hypothetical protein